MSKKKKKQQNIIKHIAIEVKRPTVPYALRQVEAIQKRARLKSSVAVEQIYPIKVQPKAEEVKTTANGMELKTVSSIRKMGYTITLPREKRWDLLKNVIIPKVGKDEVIRHIKFLITMNQGQPNKLGAVYEWQYDLERLTKQPKRIGKKKKKQGERSTRKLGKNYNID